MSPELIRALVTGLLLGVIYLGLQRIDGFKSGPFGKRVLILLPVVFLIFLVLGLIWPG